jgi:aerobic-type carbon monoxide dehydrogenase small subunit (CoxS/CutS family)
VKTGILDPKRADAMVPPLGERQATRPLDIKVNGMRYRLEVEPRRTLADVLRKDLGLTGTKVACSRAECGACTVLVNARPIYACMTLAARVHGKEVQTIEGLAKGDKLHPIQEAFIEFDALQCGFCTPGFLMSLKAMLDRSKNPNLDEVRRAISGNLCRCAAYNHIFEAALAAAKRMA